MSWYFCCFSSPHANLEFEGRGGDDFASDVSQILMQVCNNDKLIDLKKLCIIAGEQVWVLYVDIMVSILIIHFYIIYRYFASHMYYVFFISNV